MDSNSAVHVNTIGAGTGLHPGFGSGTWPPDTESPTGIPFVVVSGTRPKVEVTFVYTDEIDSGPCPIPPDPAIEGGPDTDGDRHTLIVDRDPVSPAGLVLLENRVDFRLTRRVAGPRRDRRVPIPREWKIVSFIVRDLGSVHLLSDAESRSISAENTTGDKGAGAQAEPGPENPASDLGKGWKVRPCLTLKPGQTLTLAEIEGSGTLAHIWMTVEETAYRSCVLRMYWDGEESPSVEVPLGDFFCCGHSLRCKVNSLPVAVNPSGGFNCYWPMPFRRSARITLENQWMKEIPGFYYQIDYRLEPVPENAGFFHAQWRRENPLPARTEYTILDGVCGRGHYAGVYMAWAQLSSGWWGEGEIKFFIDGDGEYPTICGTGTEDYFGGAWGFEDTFSTPFLGYPLWYKKEGEVPKHGLYRWHIPDPICFKSDLRVTIQDLGWWPNGKFQPNTDDISSVAYWYQTEPHAGFPEFPPMDQRFPR